MNPESQEWLGIKEDVWRRIVAAICECEKVSEIILYGSRAKGTFRKFSDIDITLKGEGLVHTDLFPMLTRLDDFNLPYEIDLSLYSELDYLPLIDEIDNTGVSLLSKYPMGQ